MNTSNRSEPQERPDYGTVTVLTFESAEDQQTAVNALLALINHARDAPGLIDCWVLESGPTEATMITLYASETAAVQASATMRPRLGAALGRYVTGPPQRWAGPAREHPSRAGT